MAIVYALLEFIDDQGVHPIDGQPIDFAVDTPEQQYRYDQLIGYGVIATSPPLLPDTGPKTDDKPKQRTRRRS